LDKAHFEITFQQFADVLELKVLQRSSFFITLSEKKMSKARNKPGKLYTV